MNLRSRRAVTMIEVLVSILILGVALIPILELLGRGARQERVSREETLAVVLGSELLDQIQCMPYGDLQPAADLMIRNQDHRHNLVEGRDSTMLFVTPAPDHYTRLLSIVDVNDYLRRISVTVRWGGDATHEIRLATFMEFAP